MKYEQLTPAMLERFREYLVCEERSADTIAKYLRDLHAFYAFLPEDKRLNKEAVIAYKTNLAARYKISSVNSMLVAVNRLLEFFDRRDCQVKLFKFQRASFRKAEKELTKAEYQRLLHAAHHQKNMRLYLLLQALCSTGLRVSEHRFITVEALKRGAAQVRNKGKERIVFLPRELASQLLDYCRREGITAGAVFITRSGAPLDRSNIWAMMKRLCTEAHVDPGKVYPHNLRHLFALTYYSLEKDIIHLADILGHSSVETTRIYTATSGQEQKRILARLGLLAVNI